MFFNLASCPFGWSPLAFGDGRYIVGRTSGGVGVTAGTPLSSGENRAVGQHNHTITDPGHSHVKWVSGSFGDYNAPQGGGYSAPPQTNQYTSAELTGISINNAGPVAGTNAPYIQFLVCQKD